MVDVPPWRSSGSTSAGPSRTPCSSTTASSGRRRCRPPRRRRSRSSRPPRGRRPDVGSSASRTARRSPRTRCSSARARAPRSSAPPASSTSSTCAGRRARTSTGSATDHPEPLVPLERCVGVHERIGPDGVVEPLDLDSLPELDAEAVAICLLFAFRDPTHERLVAEEVRRRLPDAHVVASHEVAPEFREYERASTTAVDAYLGPVLAALPLGARRPLPRGRARRAARDALLRRRLHARGGGGHPVARARLRAGRGVVGARGSPRSPASRTRSRSTWAAPRPTSA